MDITDAPGASVTLANWLRPPAHRWALNHVERLVPTAPVRAGGGACRRLGEVALPLDDVAVPTPEGSITVVDLLRRTATDAVVVLLGDDVVFERYFGEGDRDRRHALMSISKSIAGMAAGCLVEEGSVDLRAEVRRYVPELAASAYGTATIAHLLDMTVSLRFNHDYEDPDSDVQAQDRAAGWRPRRDGDPDGVRAFLAGLRPNGRHGAGMQYLSATTDVLAWVLERAAATPYPDLLGDRIWSRIGAEHDATVTTDPAGGPYACAGVGATARDLARFGRCVLDGGVALGHRVIPEGWIRATRDGGDPAALSDDEFRSAHPHGSYHNQWWITGDRTGAFLGIGIFGQYLWLDPARDVVVAKLSSTERARPGHLEHHALAAIAGAAQRLRVG